ncbi:MAG: HEAT repeat domain-containing protein [Bacteroidetes bacterium]|nr:HEAT repeat domain-containing protein [Bacteroidota bacterium]MBU1115167.1 HEAT repeat domain-containing protein [Bacteroidota bacterium]MBU1799338.1 HEAT repeat domain-containing protein [Bacteroidota bacterium]
MSDLENDFRLKLESNSATERKHALEALLSYDLDDELIEIVAKLFADPDKGVRDAASMLFTLQPYPQVPSYIVRYCFSDDISIRNMAGEVLLKNGDYSIPALMEELGKGNSDDEKFIIDILGWIGSPEPTEKIIEVLKTNKDENVILACAEALGNIKAEEAVPVLLELLKNDVEEILTPTVMEALGKIGNKEAVNHFMKVYNDQDILTKYTIIESLGRVGDAESLGFLLEELQQTELSLVGPIVKSSEQLLSNLGFEIELSDELKLVILKALEENDEDTVLSAVKLLYNYENKEIIEAFVSIYGTLEELDEMLKDKFIQTYQISRNLILDRIINKGENTKKLLILYKEISLISEEFDFEPLSDTNQLEFLNTLSELIDNPDEEVRMTAAELLFQINPKDALLFADKIINDDNVWNRLKLIELLSEVNEPQAIDLLKKLADDSDEMVRERALSLLDDKKTRI